MTIEQLNSTTEQRELVLEIMSRAMIVSQEGIAEVHVNYGGAWDTLCVTAHTEGTVYADGNPPDLFRHNMISLSDTDQLKQALNDINALYDNWETSQEIVLAVQ